jgi:hypothetical protein
LRRVGMPYRRRIVRLAAKADAPGAKEIRTDPLPPSSVDRAGAGRFLPNVLYYGDLKPLYEEIKATTGCPPN